MVALSINQYLSFFGEFTESFPVARSLAALFLDDLDQSIRWPVLVLRDHVLRWMMR
jgi:hypothetical protein